MQGNIDKNVLRESIHAYDLIKLKFSIERLDRAMELLKSHTYEEIAELTGVSKSTKWREAQKLNFYKRLDLIK